MKTGHVVATVLINTGNQIAQTQKVGSNVLNVGKDFPIMQAQAFVLSVKGECINA